jgi:hypothetical protein
VADADPQRDRYAEAERLMREAQQTARQAAASASQVPPHGWSVPGAEPPAPGSDLGPIAALVESMRGVVTPELTRQLADALRDLLIALRAVLDWYIVRLDPVEPVATEVQDIPVD